MARSIRKLAEQSNAAHFQKNKDGIRVAAEITKLRPADIAFDSRTRRVIAEAEGTINVYETALPAL